jgi:hypothetical protein
MTILTPELRREIERAGDLPVRIQDPETLVAYVLLKEKVYQRIRQMIPREQLEGSSNEDANPHSRDDFSVIPEGMRRSLEAFRRDLPELLKDPNLHGKWVAYKGDERIGIAQHELPLLSECTKRGLEPGEFITDVIELKPDEPEEIDFPSSWR